MVYSCIKLKSNEIFTSSMDGTIKMWDIESMKCMNTFLKIIQPINI